MSLELLTDYFFL